jgi:hypothetical protein
MASNTPKPNADSPSRSWDTEASTTMASMCSPLITPSDKASRRKTGRVHSHVNPSMVSTRNDRLGGGIRGGSTIIQRVSAARPKAAAFSQNGVGRDTTISKPAKGGPMKRPKMVSML